MPDPKKKQKKKKGSRKNTKMSEMVWEFAGDFIRMGDTLEDRQSNLNGACSAWNIACDNPRERNRLLDKYLESYLSYNPNASDEDLAAVRENMEKLIQNKLKLFPSVKRQIVGASIQRKADKDYLEIASLSYKNK